MIYEIKMLRCWWGDSFHDSYDYVTIGYTDDEEFVNELRKNFIVSKDLARGSWPLCHMEGWKIFRCEEHEIIDPQKVYEMIDWKHIYPEMDEKTL